MTAITLAYAHFPMIVSFLKNLAMTIVGGLFTLMVVPVLWVVKPLLDGE